MKRFMGGLVGVLVVSVIILSRTDWGKQQIGEVVTGWFSGHASSAQAGASTEPAQPGATLAPQAGNAAGSSAPAAASKPQREIPPLPTLRPKSAVEAPPSQGGQFRVMIAYDQNAPGERRRLSLSPARQLVHRSRILFEDTAYLNRMFELPKDVPVIVRHCGLTNMYWDRQKEEITVCDEMIEELGRLFSDLPDEETFNQEVLFATSFFMFHEVGHGLVQEYGLKSLGKSEDIADQIAVLLLLGNGQAEKIAAGANAFMRFAKDRPKDAPVAFWDEHSLDEQRYYNLVCMIYGSNPKQFASLVRNNVLPAERAGRCPGEFADAVAGFNEKLGPHVKR